MANREYDRDSQWIDERLDALTPPALDPDGSRARIRLAARDQARTRRVRQLLVVGTAVCLALAVLPWPRAIAQQVWNRLSLNRVAIVQVAEGGLPDEVTAALTLEPLSFDESQVTTLDAAEQLLGFRAALPPDGVLGGVPKLSVVRMVALASQPLRVQAIRQALAAAGVADFDVPDGWEGTTLRAEAGPVLIARYDGVELMQSAPFRMHTPAGFEFERFMEMTFRVFGRPADEARRLGRKFQENPALILHFPEHEPVRDIALRSGRGTIVGAQDGICFFWNTSDRVFIVSAETLSDRDAAALADSVQVP